jgi:hypothetical protein
VNQVHSLLPARIRQMTTSMKDGWRKHFASMAAVLMGCSSPLT